MARTNANAWRQGTRLNLERSLCLGDKLGGHIVTGHTDGPAKIISVEDFDRLREILIRAPRDLARFIAENGSISLNGTLRTVKSIGGK